MKRRLLLKDLVIVDAEGSYNADLRIWGKQVEEIGPGLIPGRHETVMECSGQLASPAFINSHDHLHFNLYHRIGDPPYNNAQEWGLDLHNRWSRAIENIENIPIRIRYLWGAWKNLFSGVSRVVHHDSYSQHFRFFFPVDVLQRFTFVHSIYNEPNLKQALALRKSDTPFIIHLAEGTDESSATEVAALGRIGGLDERTIAVHAINLCPSDIALLIDSGSSVVWCPSSNIFLFNRTAPIEKLQGKLPIALGTDSTLTGVSTLFEEMRVAHESTGCSPRDLFRMVTTVPGKIFRLSDDAGVLRRGGRADLFLLPMISNDPYESILHANPGDISLMMTHGKVVFSDENILPHAMRSRHNHPFRLNGRQKAITDRRFAFMIDRLGPFLSHYPYLIPN